MVPQLLLERPLLRTLLAQQYPFLFVDESQDTTAEVVKALKAVEQQVETNFCLGLFGDPMQRIYPMGVGAIQLELGWKDITKPENFRCPTVVLKIANSIRSPIGDLVQVRGRMDERDGRLESIFGSANFFILPADGRRSERLSEVRAWIASHINDQAWRMDAGGTMVNVFVIVHRMAANRLGFGTLYAALNDKAPDGFKSGFLDATAWPIRPFISFVLPLSEAMRDGNDFEVMQILRKYSPLLARDHLGGVDIAERLSKLKELTIRLRHLTDYESTSTNAEVLKFLQESGLVTLDPRIVSYISTSAQSGEAEPVPDENEDIEDLAREVVSMEAFLACPVVQFWSYRTYVNEESPFSTHQGIKGAEFDRVLVVLDDDEGTHAQFSYEKYFGIKPLTDKDKLNIQEGKETSVERTRRLFYVCCTRALKDLVVVLFTADVGMAERQIRSLEIFPTESIHTVEALTSA